MDERKSLATAYLADRLHEWMTHWVEGHQANDRPFCAAALMAEEIVSRLYIRPEERISVGDTVEYGGTWIVEDVNPDHGTLLVASSENPDTHAILHELHVRRIGRA